jgi:hypothetical protein
MSPERTNSLQTILASPSWKGPASLRRHAGSIFLLRHCRDSPIKIVSVTQG